MLSTLGPATFGLVDRDEHLFEAEILDAPGWCVRARFGLIDYQFLLLELSVIPCQGTTDEIPPGGLTGSVLKAISVREISERTYNYVRGIANSPFGGLIHEDFANARRVLKRGVRDDRFYALWAKFYADKVASGSSRPNAELAEEHGLKPTQVRDILTQCRRRQLLPRLPKNSGKAVGVITPKAAEILKGMEQ